MKINNSKEIKIAALGILAILMFVFGFNYLKGSGIFSSTRKVMASYHNVQGLTPSSYVQLQGFNIGAVQSIELSKNEPGKVLVIMNINKEIVIPEDSKAKIVSLDLLGTKAVNIVLGKSTKPLGDNQSILGEIELGTIESLGASAGPAIDKINSAVASLDTTIHAINNILDVSTQNSLKATFTNLNSTMQEFSQFAKELNAQRAKISSLIANLNSFSANLDKNNSTITRVLNNAETTTANLSKVNFDATVNELKKTLDDLQITLNKVNHGNGSLAMLMNDDKLYKNLKNTLATANNLLYDINARPSRYINVNIFGKKQKNECPPAPAPNAND
ncbi:MAG: MCE family protein [Chitinophagaceae bacterium]|nr:MCE family protein [Chitinophagaceae bacterium]